MTCHFFCNCFFTLFSFPMYLERPYLEMFFDLSLFIMWKRPKIGRKVEIRPKIGYSSKWWRTIFSVIFFSLFFLHRCIHRDHTPRRFSIYHFLLCGSVQKMAAKLKFDPKSAIPLNVVAPFFLLFFYTLFSSSMYSWRSYRETFFNLSLFNMWKSSKKALDSRLKVLSL